MKRLLLILLLTTGLFAQNPPAQPAQTMPPDTKAPPAVADAPAQPGEDPGAARARRLISEMIQALGGRAYLTYTTVQQQGRTYGFSRGEPAGSGAPFWRFYQWPNKERTELLKTREWIIVFNGDRGWERTYHGVSPVEKEDLQDYLRRRHYSLENVLRNWINEPGIAFFYEGVATAGRHPAEQVSLLNIRNEGVTIYIDQNTRLPIMKKFTWRDPETRERVEESELYDNYKSVQGIMTPQATTRARNGLNTNQRFISSITYNQPLPETLFQPPAQAEQKRN